MNWNRFHRLSDVSHKCWRKIWKCLHETWRVGAFHLPLWPGNFVDDIWYFFAKAENSSHQFIFGTRWPRFGHYSALQGASTRRIEKKNFGVRTYVQSVLLTQTIHTKPIACSLSTLLWLLIVHFEEFRFERISVVHDPGRWSVFSRRSRLIWPDWTWCWQVFSEIIATEISEFEPGGHFS